MQILTDLASTRDATIAHYDLSPEDLAKTYGESKWSVKFILHHLADTETVLYDRIRRTISVPGQVVWGFEQDAWARELNYADMPLAISLDIFRSCRAGIMHLAQNHYESGGEKPFVHSNMGLRTLKDEFDKVVWHNQRHLDQIVLALQS